MKRPTPPNPAPAQWMIEAEYAIISTDSVATPNHRFRLGDIAAIIAKHAPVAPTPAAPVVKESLTGDAAKLAQELADAITVFGNRSFDLAVARDTTKEEYQVAWDKQEKARATLQTAIAALTRERDRFKLDCETAQEAALNAVDAECKLRADLASVRAERDRAVRLVEEAVTREGLAVDECRRTARYADAGVYDYARNTLGMLLHRLKFPPATTEASK